MTGHRDQAAACRCWMPIHLQRGRPCPEHPESAATKKPLLCRLGFHDFLWNGSVYECRQRCGHTYEPKFTEYDGSIWNG